MPVTHGARNPRKPPRPATRSQIPGREAVAIALSIIKFLGRMLEKNVVVMKH